MATRRVANSLVYASAYTSARARRRCAIAALIATVAPLAIIGSIAPARTLAATDTSARTTALVAETDAPASSAATPLFDYATSLPTYSQPFNEPLRKQIATFEAEMARHPPPSDEECSHTLGATRFARQYEDLGSAQSNAGDYPAAIEAFEKAVACMPRSATLHAALAAELMHVGRLADARAAIQRGVAIDAGNRTDSSGVDQIYMQLDYIDERWADTVARLRAMLASNQIDAERATYYQCFLWLAQRRAGVKLPEKYARRDEDFEEWPVPILEHLQGQKAEAQVLEQVKVEKNEPRRREMLVEALYYIGQLRLANGDTENARRYFAATVNLKVTYFIEHHMALAEITKLRNRMAEAPGAALER